MTMIISAVVVAVIVIWYIAAYNGLVKLRMQGQESWSQIDVQLQRRNDLIPNLLETVKGYGKYEASTLTAVTELRQQVATTTDHQAKMAASDQLSGALNNLYAVAENYPDLKASEEYSRLMEELSNTENKIAYARQLYNSTVSILNARIQSFPANIVAKLHHFMPMEFLQVPESAKEAPKVSFD